jgi:hypothetical protein
MSDSNDDSSATSGTRFPFISLEKAIGRTQELYGADQKGRELSVASAFDVWKYSAKSSGGFQTIGALKEYGLVRSVGAGKVQLTPEALLYFRDERESEHERLRMHFAHRPKLIQKVWVESQWGASPPADPVARSHLKNEIGLSEQSARSFLSIYKENIAFAGFKADSMPPEQNTENIAEPGGKGGKPPPPPPASGEKAKIMAGERELTTGLLSKGSNFRLIVSGPVGVKEIERLIAKLELDKEILAESADDEGGVE